MSKAVKWAWRYYALGAVVYDTLDEAIESAIYAADAGAEALDCIEYEGERITTADPRYRVVQRRIHEAEEAARRDRTLPTHRVDAKHPDGEWVPLFGVTMPLSESTAEEVQELTSALGDDRVRVRKV